MALLALGLVGCDDADDGAEGTPAPVDAGMASMDGAAPPVADGGETPETDSSTPPSGDAEATPEADARVTPLADAGSEPPVDDCPQLAMMLDLSNAPGPNVEEGFMPSLTAACEGDSFVVTTNGIPPYTYEHPRIRLFEEPNTWRIPRNPQLADTITYPSGRHGIERIGFAVNGLQAYTPIEAAMPVQFQYGNPVTNGLTNNCGGHSAAANLGYHYHRLVEECVSAANVEAAEPWTGLVDPTVPSPVVGFAADGFAIYGLYECADADCDTIVELKSGYRLKDGGSSVTCAYMDYEYMGDANDPTVLDECNGHTHLDGGDYHYHLTAEYPYQTACFRGTPDESVINRPGTSIPGSEDVCP